MVLLAIIVAAFFLIWRRMNVKSQPLFQAFLALFILFIGCTIYVAAYNLAAVTFGTVSSVEKIRLYPASFEGQSTYRIRSSDGSYVYFVKDQSGNLNAHMYCDNVPVKKGDGYMERKYWGLDHPILFPHPKGVDLSLVQRVTIYLP